VTGAFRWLGDSRAARGTRRQQGGVGNVVTGVERCRTYGTSNWPRELRANAAQEVGDVHTGRSERPLALSTPEGTQREDHDVVRESQTIGNDDC